MKTLDLVIASLFTNAVCSSRLRGRVGEVVELLSKEDREVLQTATADDFIRDKREEEIRAWVGYSQKKRIQDEIEILAKKSSLRYILHKL